MDFFQDWIIANFGVSVLVLIGVIVIAVSATLWINNLRNKVNNLPCSEHKKTLDNHSDKIISDASLLHKIDGHLSSIDREIGTLTGQVTTLNSELLAFSRAVASFGIGPQAGTSLTQSHSPISLSQKGIEIAKALNLESVIDRNWDKISGIIKEEINPYDIQMEFITRMMFSYDGYLDNESVDLIKKDAYLQGLSLAEYMRMLGVMARDRYFKEHGIDIEEVDRNDPNLMGK